MLSTIFQQAHNHISWSRFSTSFPSSAAMRSWFWASSPVRRGRVESIKWSKASWRVQRVAHSSARNFVINFTTTVGRLSSSAILQRIAAAWKETIAAARRSLARLTVCRNAMTRGKAWVRVACQRSPIVRSWKRDKLSRFQRLELQISSGRLKQLE